MLCCSGCRCCSLDCCSRNRPVENGWLCPDDDTPALRPSLSRADEVRHLISARNSDRALCSSHGCFFSLVAVSDHAWSARVCFASHPGGPLKPLFASLLVHEAQGTPSPLKEHGWSGLFETFAACQLQRRIRPRLLPDGFQSQVTHSMDEQISNHELRAKCAARAQRGNFYFVHEISQCGRMR